MSDSEAEPSNPIVALAMKLRAKRSLSDAVDSATPLTVPDAPDDAAAALAAFGDALKVGTKRLNSILGKTGVTFVRLEKPLRLRLRFGEKRVSLDLDAERQLVVLTGDGLEGEYQFSGSDGPPALINLSKLSTDAGYGEAITANMLLKRITSDAELPPPPHLQGPGPLAF